MFTDFVLLRSIRLPPSRCTVLTAGTACGGVSSSIRREPLGTVHGVASGPDPPRIRATGGARRGDCHFPAIATSVAEGLYGQNDRFGGNVFSLPSRTNAPRTIPQYRFGNRH